MNTEFWNYLQALVDSSNIVIERPKGIEHHSFPGKFYPVDYGYIENTISNDGNCVDIWVGSHGDHKVVGILCTVDLLKRDTELKLIIDCTKGEIESITEFVNEGEMRALCFMKS